jgi:hypothetical protein
MRNKNKEIELNLQILFNIINIISMPNTIYDAFNQQTFYRLFEYF